MFKRLFLNNAITNDILNRLKSNDPQLVELNFSNRELTDFDVETLCKAAQNNTHLRKLDLAGNRFGIRGVQAVVGLSSVRELDLSSNNLGDPEAKILAESSSITKLRLRHNKSIGDQGAIALAKNAFLKVLDLSGNTVSDHSAQAFASSTLVELDLSWSHSFDRCTITDQFAVLLSTNKTLTTVDFSENYIGSKGAQALARMHNLRRLYLNKTKFGDNEAELFVNHHSLTELAVSDTPITVVGVCALLKRSKLATLVPPGKLEPNDNFTRAIQSNTTLTLFDQNIFRGDFERLDAATKDQITKNRAAAYELVVACTAGDVNKASILLKKGVLPYGKYIASCNPDGDTLPHIAIKLKNQQLLDLLLSYGAVAECNRYNKAGYTYLELASQARMTVNTASTKTIDPYEAENKILQPHLAAAEKGDAAAQETLAQIYYFGKNGIVKNDSKAAYWFHQAAQQGHADAQYNFGVMCHNEKADGHDKKESVVWFKKAAEQGNASAQYALACCYLDSEYANYKLTPDDSAYAEKIYKQYNEPLPKDGWHYPNYAARAMFALPWFVKAALGGNEYAKAKVDELAKGQFKGIMPTQNVHYKLILDRYEDAAKAGNKNAQVQLAHIYIVKQNYQQAKYWAEIAKNIPEAQRLLGYLYHYGYGVERNYVMAEKLYQQAAAGGDKVAVGFLSDIKSLAQAQREEERVKTEEKAKEEKQQRDQDEMNQNLKKYLELQAKSTSSASSSKSSSSSSAAGSDAINSMGQISLSLEIPYAQLTIEKKLGEGGFGIVYQAKWQFSDVAVKQLRVGNLIGDSLDEFKHEASVMAKLRNPHIIQLYGICINQPYCLVMEFATKGSLYAVLHSSEEMDWPRRLKIAAGIAKGLAYLHHQNPVILHRDIKSMNVLLDESYTAKLTDFGLAKIRDTAASASTAAGAVGTLHWMAPELFDEDDGHYTKACDVYSLAILFWELSSRKLPYEGKKSQQIIAMALQGKRETIPANCPPQFAAVIANCWKQTASERPVIENVIKSLEQQPTNTASTVQSGYVSLTN